jgi:hypothetical protein
MIGCAYNQDSLLLATLRYILEQFSCINGCILHSQWHHFKIDDQRYSSFAIAASFKSSKETINIAKTYFAYPKVLNSRLSWLVAHPSIFRMFTWVKFDAFVLWPLAKSFQNWIVDRSTARYFTVYVVHKLRVARLLYDI